MNIPFCSALSNVSKRLGALKVVVQVAKIEPITAQGFENEILEVIGAQIDEKPAAWLRWLEITPKPVDASPLDLTRVAREYAQLAKTFGLLDSGYSLLENAIPLRSYTARRTPDVVTLWKYAKINPLHLDSQTGIGEKALFWQIVIRGDVLTCAFTDILSRSAGSEYDPNQEFRGSEDGNKLEEVERNLMLKAFSVVRAAFEDSLWSEVENLDELRNYCERMKRWSSFRHHVPPRLEWLVDLQLLKRHGPDGDGDDQISAHAYSILDACRRAGRFLADSLLKDFDGDRFIHYKLFSFLNHVYSLDATKDVSDEEVFRYLAAGYRFVARDLGDTPAKSAATMGAILALEQKRLINLNRMYEVGRKPPASYAWMMEYSGGSRLDEEFMFSIRPKALRQLFP